MTTITFYSYKGGTGRSLALANAARYLTRLEFSVVALDLDLEAPGLHYKFLKRTEETPLPIPAGIADYIHEFLIEGRTPKSIRDFTVEVDVPGQSDRVINLIPAGRVPSKEYWATLSRINWHELFYSPTGAGVQMFLDLKSRISDELNPDFLLIDSRTGITEMGGVATTLLADKVLCLVLPTLENLEGARAVLRSLRKSRCEIGAGEAEILLALSRLPEIDDAGEREEIKRILDVLNEPAEDLADTLTVSEVLVLHSEARLQLQEGLRVGSGISPDQSILLRDYLRLFFRLVPKELIEPKIGRLVEDAKAKIWEDADGATKAMEELAESFGHPNVYRELLRFYDVRNVSGERLLRRAQRLWDLTRDSSDVLLWQAVSGNVVRRDPWPRAERGWIPDLGFVEAVWRDAGRRHPKFGMMLAEMWSDEKQPSRAADVALEIISRVEPTASVAARCIGWLGAADRRLEADTLIRRVAKAFGSDREFLDAWVEHAIVDRSALADLLKDPEIMEALLRTRPLSAARVLMRSGAKADAAKIADEALRQAIGERSHQGLLEVGELFSAVGRFPDFEKALKDNGLPAELTEEVRRGRRLLRRGLK